MAELEKLIEERLIKQLCSEDSQWNYRPDIKNEEDLWKNFKYILEQNNKDKLNDTELTEQEFAKIKNDVSHQSFYDAAKWLVGENGRVYVHIQRGNEQLHLLVMNNEHVAGGTSTYEVINQYQAFAEEDDLHGRDRRFDVTLLINGLPMIHIELKNRSHSYYEGFNQIKKYMEEGKFRGAFSNVQMFVVSNGVDTKYFAASRNINKKFLTRWLDHNNEPVCDYIEFAKEVLRIPEAHEMVTKYTILDNDKKNLLILRPYQIHAIEAMRAASKQGKSGYIWHTTGSGKTMTSYKATRNLLMDIPSIEKTIFLIDRKDLDMQTKMAFQSYADNDTIDVDETDNVDDLVKKLYNGNRQMIVTTRQKLQTMINKRLVEGTKQYEKIRSLKVAFVVDECHRAVTPQTKRDIEAFFRNSLWYGFTGTPIFEENQYETKGDLAQTTEQLYGECLHSYTIKEAIKDEAVLGFLVENIGVKDMTIAEEEKSYGTISHMRKVLDYIINKSMFKLGFQNGKGRTYEALLTVKSIAEAQMYYDLLKKVVNGEDELKVSEEVKKVLPDFPKFAITYSVTETEEDSSYNQSKMEEAIDDYNKMFDKSYKLDQINAYNQNLNDRLARKDTIYKDRSQQLDLVIVVDRLLTGFDAPCLSTLFIDRPPMNPQGLLQAFSRTNRIFDANKQLGQIVTFQYRDQFKEAINETLRLYSRGGGTSPVSEDWEEVRESFSISVKALKGIAPEPESTAGLSKELKKAFVHSFRDLDHDFAHLKAFSCYDEIILEKNDFSQELYEKYAAVYKNILNEINPHNGDDLDGDTETETVYDDYDLVAYNKIKVTFEYIVELLQGFVDNLNYNVENFNEAKFEYEIAQIKAIIDEFIEDNPKLGALLLDVLEDIKADKEKYLGQDIYVTLNHMKYEIIDREIKAFADKWFIPFEDVKYEAFHFRDGEMANENNFKEKADYAAYKEATENPVPKFKFRSAIVNEFKDELMPEVEALLS